MTLVEIPANHPCLFWGGAFVTSSYLGVRAIFIQMHRVEQENAGYANAKPPLRQWNRRDRVIVHYIQDSLFNFVCSVTGWVALYGLTAMLRSVADLGNMQAGSGIVVVFLSLLAIIGISGALPFVILHGKIFGAKG